MAEKQVISKKRVADHGEVLTGKREVNAMLDLVKQETERIDSRFLEPACGTGNFLTEVLTRKLRVVSARYGKSQLEYERNAVLAVSSLYGIDILEDNVAECRKRLFDIFDQAYIGLFKNTAKDECRNSVRFILRSEITTGVEMIDKWKVISSRSGHDHAGNPGKDGKRRVLSKIDILPPGTICTETYLVIGVYEEETQAKNLISYMHTRFFRFLLSLFMYSHSITKDTYMFVPILDMNTHWTDGMLYERYGVTGEEISFIESKIRPMEVGSE